ncbi:response regulator transcription factor [Kurthia huakuii]|uniref:response regulator transcription factor n=1 Tax=Kurthia huakuii TaxID=1421019 RepID=UPI000496E539|nr:response regulator transcription factor [Kurthia huakuii]MBM7699763.1 DNA-binding response OmpR family regulator [Kurthia huakuii]
MEYGKLLLVDDELAILTMLQTILIKEGFTKIDTATTAEVALHYCGQQSYDLILLDVMLPGQSGFDICPQIRRLTNAPIFFVTARTSDLDKLSGFALGGDDYITKPFNPLEVVARIKAQLRRLQLPTEMQTTLQFPNLTIYTTSGEVYFKGEAIELSAQVYQLLLFFAKHPNQLFTKSQLYENVWQDAYLGEDNTVMVHIRKLRQKIECDPSNPKRIVTVRGLGYKFMPGAQL